jgi:transcriptional regulator with XRE-family HTH domain|tara:strand:+ start:539 stop:763 length:225 start_codon:yes stop_codon:yes gene_type:complete
MLKHEITKEPESKAAKKLQQLWIDSGLSIRDFAKEVGINHNQLHQYIISKQTPSLGRAYDLEKKHGIVMQDWFE